MKSTSEIASHPKAVLHRDIVERLRASGSVMGAEMSWNFFRLHRGLWRKIVTFGLDRVDRQQQLTKIAFPDCNWPEVEAALNAGNKLKAVYDLACGSGSIAKDAIGNYITGRHGVKIIRHTEPTRREDRRPATH